MRKDKHIYHLELRYHQNALASDGLSKKRRTKRKRKESQVCLLL